MLRNTKEKAAKRACGLRFYTDWPMIRKAISYSRKLKLGRKKEGEIYSQEKMTETTYRPRVMSERALKTRAKIMNATRAFIVREVSQSIRSLKNPARAKVPFFITLRTVRRCFVHW